MPGSGAPSHQALFHEPCVGATGAGNLAYSFVGTLLPDEALRPAGILILVWFAAIAIFDRPRAARESGE